MKIYKNENDQLVIDGDGITTIKVPSNLKGLIGINEWLESRLTYTGTRDENDPMAGKIMYNGKIIVTGFIFTMDDNKDETKTKMFDDSSKRFKIT